MKKLFAAAALPVVVLAACSPPPAAATPVTTVVASPSASPALAPTTAASQEATQTPAAVKTSGDYGADLAAAGVVPDSVTRYGQFMKEQLCDVPLTKDPFWDYSQFSESIRTLGSADSDQVAATRLTVAYFCPERAALAEEALLLHGYVK